MYAHFVVSPYQRSNEGIPEARLLCWHSYVHENFVLDWMPWIGYQVSNERES